MTLEDTTAAERGALQELAAFPLLEALHGRRSRRFALGDEIPDGPLAYKSKHDPMPLSDLERMLVLSAMGGTTGGITRSRDTNATPRIFRTTRAERRVARSRRPRVSTPPSSSSRMTQARTSSQPVTPARSSTRQSRR